MTRTLLGTLLGTLLVAGMAAGAGIGGENGLQVNRWTQVTTSDPGVRHQSAVVWLEDQKLFLILCGLGKAKDAGGVPYEVQSFDPAKRTWQNCFPADKAAKWGDPSGFSKAPGFSGPGGGDRYICAKDKEGNLRLEPGTSVSEFFAYDPAGRKIYVCLAGHHFDNELKGKRMPLFSYDVAARTWKYLGDSPPPIEEGRVYGNPAMARTKIVFDPVNREMLFLGGHCPGAPRGSIGNWALSPEGGKWRRLLSESKALAPLREKVLAAKAKARDAMAFARNVFYKSLPAAEESAEMKGLPAKTGAEAVALLKTALGAVKGAKADGWEAKAAAKADERLSLALSRLTAAAGAFGSGKVDPASLKAAFEASWAIDEAADFLRSSPGSRAGAAAVYDAENRSVVLFGGEHGDYLMSDTWVYDCAKRAWRRLFCETAPRARTDARMVWLPKRKAVCMIGGGTYSPRFSYHSRSYQQLRDYWVLDAAAGRWAAVAEIDLDTAKGKRFALESALAADDRDYVLGVAMKNFGYRKGAVSCCWMLKLGEPKAALTAKLGAPGDARTYMTVVREYDPTWYDAAPRGDQKTQAAFLAGLKANTWTDVPQAPRPCPQRDWGTAVFDAKRDQFYHWTGGHMADPATIVSTYHVAIGRWSIPYVGEYLEKGMSFNGRPDCQNHTYLNYAFDLKTNRMVCINQGGTSVYDPDRREFIAHVPPPFRFAQYTTKTVGTPQGVIAWESGFLGLFDAEKMAWKKLPVTGKIPPVIHGDCNNMTWDPKRKCVWMSATKSFSAGSGQMWKYELDGGKLTAMNPKGIERLGWMSRIRETCYLPKQDLVLHNVFCNDRQVAYDPAKNRWVTLSIPQNIKGLGGVGLGMMYDPKRDLVWAAESQKRMHVLKVDSKTLKITEDLDRASRKKGK